MIQWWTTEYVHCTLKALLQTPCVGRAVGEVCTSHVTQDLFIPGIQAVGMTFLDIRVGSSIRLAHPVTPIVPHLAFPPVYCY